jgi:hypothetical protein
MEEKKIKDVQMTLNRLLLEKTEKTIKEMEMMINKHIEIQPDKVTVVKEKANKNL